VWRRVLFLLLALAPGAAAPALAETGEVVGRLIAQHREVSGSSSGLAPQRLGRLAQVLLGMLVHTDSAGRADIALQRVREGKLRLGPDTRVEFNERVVAGLPPVMTLRQQIGQLQLVLMPRGRAPGEGEYWIESKAGRVRVRGTSVYVRVDRWGMDVAVLEGEVEVEATNGEIVKLAAGEWTHVSVDDPPEAPRPIDRSGGGGPPEGLPDDGLIIDPPELDLRFDLPK
jgi:ferric-dicitrate binding protein FerR (iron transport regulator)